MSYWLDAQHVGVEQLDEASVEAFLPAQRASGRDRSSLSWPGLLCLLEFLAGVPPAVGPEGAAPD